MNVITLSDEQMNIYNEIMKFINDDKMNELLLIGYAGTGKTTLISKLIYDLIKLKIINRIAVAAPTHKAVGILKNKLLNLENLKNHLEILTIHRLLNYQNYIDMNGNSYFAQNSIEPNWNIYNLIIVDECSMLNDQIIIDIDQEINKKENSKIKIIYVGDPAQLPPVNQKTSKIFEKNIKKLILENILRTSNNDILELSKQHRNWIIYGDNNIPNLSLFNSNNVQLFFNDQKNIWLDKFIQNNLSSNSYDNTIILTWTNNKCNQYNDYIRKHIFNKKILNKYEKHEILIFNDFYKLKLQNNNYINFYTSEQVKINDINIKTMFLNKICIKKNLSLPIKINDLIDKYINKINKLINIELKIYVLTIQKILNNNSNFFQSNINKNITKINNFLHSDKKFVFKNQLIINKLISKTNLLINNYYEFVSNYFFDNSKSKSSNSFDIITIHQDDYLKYKSIVDKGINYIIKLKNKVHIALTNLNDPKISNINKIEYFTIFEKKINNIWKEFNNNVVDYIATLNYGYCITVHKSQGSTFKNVFIDISDIFDNKNKDETIKCLYTAITRTSHNVFLLI